MSVHLSMDWKLRRRPWNTWAQRHMRTTLIVMLDPLLAADVAGGLEVWDTIRRKMGHIWLSCTSQLRDEPWLVESYLKPSRGHFSIPKRRDPLAASPGISTSAIARDLLTAFSRSTRHRPRPTLAEMRCQDSGPLAPLSEEWPRSPHGSLQRTAIRMNTVFRKVTNGFRSDWDVTVSAVRSMVNTGKRHGLPAFQSIQTALSPVGSRFDPDLSRYRKSFRDQLGDHLAFTKSDTAGEVIFPKTDTLTNPIFKHLSNMNRAYFGLRQQSS